MDFQSIHFPGLLLVSDDETQAEVHVPSLTLRPGMVAVTIVANDDARLCLLREVAGLPERRALGWRAIADSLREHNTSRVGVVLENPDTQLSGLFEDTVSELLLPLAWSAKSSDALRSIARYELAVWGLLRNADTPVSELSDGQRQRLLYSSMTLSDNACIVSDGGLGFIDPLDRVRLLAYLKVHARANSRSMLFLCRALDTTLGDLIDSVLDTRYSAALPVETDETITLDDKSVMSADVDTILLDISGLQWTPPDSGVSLFNGLSVRAQLGDIVIVCGPNGSGKSSLAWLLSGDEMPTTGKVTICGKVPDPSLSPVSLSPADPDFVLVRDTVADEIARHPRARLTEADLLVVRRVLGLVGFEERKPFDLTWSERRRLGLLRAAAAAPSILFLDEPTADSSDEEVAYVLEAMGLFARRGLLVLCATNDSRLIGSVAPRQIVRLPRARGMLPTRGEKHVCDPEPFSPGPARLESSLTASNAEVDTVSVWSERAVLWLERTPEFCLFWERRVYPEIQRMVGALVLPREALLLDLGCGTGLHTRAVRSILGHVGCRVTSTIGIDATPEFVELADLYRVPEVDERFVQADLRTSACLDAVLAIRPNENAGIVVTAMFVLHDVDSLEYVSKMLQAVRREGGVFLAVLVSPDHIDNVAMTSGQLSRVRKAGQGVSCDWIYKGHLRVSADDECALEVPYFHRPLTKYVRMVESDWGPVQVHSAADSDRTAIRVGERSAVRTDQLVFLTSTAAGVC